MNARKIVDSEVYHFQNVDKLEFSQDFHLWGGWSDAEEFLVSTLGTVYAPRRRQISEDVVHQEFGVEVNPPNYFCFISSLL